MEYRHLRHAGNFADVFKHSLLVQLLRALMARHPHLAYWESHAGAGAYRLPVGGGRDGIARLLALPDPPAPLADYLRLVRASQRHAQTLRYPGSPCLAATVLRQADTLRLAERDAEAARALRRRLAWRAHAHVEQGDGADRLRAWLASRHGPALALVDPPFVRATESAAALALLSACARHQSVTGVLWYPLRHDVCLDAATAHAASALRVEMRVRAPDAGMWGCGLRVVHPPAAFSATAVTVLEALLPVLGQDAQAVWSLQE